MVPKAARARHLVVVRLILAVDDCNSMLREMSSVAIGVAADEGAAVRDDDV